MIKKHFWRILYLIFVIFCLINIFEKLWWSAPTDNILWKPAPEGEGLVCVEAPENSPIKKGDTVLTVNKFVITNVIDLNRVIRQRKTKTATYEIERDGILRKLPVDIATKYTPFSYYILAFSGILLILLTLSILNTNLKKKRGFSPPVYFYLMSLSFSGFLIFSPTGTYNTMDFVFLFLDKLCFIFFPALMLHYSLYFPFRLKIVRSRFIRPKFLKIVIYMAPTAILVINILFLFTHMVDPDPEILTLSINNFREISYHYFTLYLILGLISFIISNLWLIFQREQKRFLVPLTGICISIPTMIFLNALLTAAEKTSSLSLRLTPFLLVFLPLALTYYLGHRKFTDIENIIKKTASIGSIFLFIFGIFFVLGSAIAESKLLGIFWSMATIVMAGLLFRPIEETVHKYFEKLFFRGAATFKQKLTELIQSFRNERNLSLIATNFLHTINKGFQLQKSDFIIHHRKNIFYSLPQKRKILLSKSFRGFLFANENVVLSAAEFERRFPKDYRMMRHMNYFQFLPLKTQDRLVGLIAFGPKEDNTYLSVEDWEIMFNIASPLTISVENASLYSELETQLDEISLLKEFNENIIENINVGIVVLTTLNIIKTWNDFMALKFRIPAAKAIGTKAHTTFGPELWKQIYKKRQDASVSSIHNLKVDLLQEELVVDVHISPLKDSQGKVMGTILVFEDVTEKIMMQNQMITSEKMASLGVLSAGLAHEVNTPLTGISSFCQFILDNPQDPENIELISKIQEQVQRANKIIRTLLDFSRQQKAEVPTDLDLNKLINESIALVEHNLKKKNIMLNKEFHFKHKFFGYSTRLQQMFINLLINASDAITDSNGIISISGIETNSDIMIRIKDNGKGIAPRYMKKIFDPFFTTKEKGKGTGLGLSITYSIVHEHYGEITVKSKLDKGTTFIITFPLKSPLRSMKL